MIDAARTIVRAKPLRHDAFAAKRARLLEDGWPVRVEVRVQRYAVVRVTIATTTASPRLRMKRPRRGLPLPGKAL